MTHLSLILRHSELSLFSRISSDQSWKKEKKGDFERKSRFDMTVFFAKWRGKKRMCGA